MRSDQHGPPASLLGVIAVLKSPLPGSEELLRRIPDALGPNRRPLLIAIDGPDGVGKSSLASWLAWQFGMPTVHLDLYLIRGSRPLKWRTDEVDRLIQARANLGGPVHLGIRCAGPNQSPSRFPCICFRQGWAHVFQEAQSISGPLRPSETRPVFPERVQRRKSLVRMTLDATTPFPQ